MKYCIVFILTVILTGCLFYVRKDPTPISGDKASLTIDAPGLNEDGFHFFTRDVTVYVHSDSDSDGCPWKKNSDLTYQFSVDLKYGEYKKIVDIPVGKEIFFELHDSYGNQLCPQSARFNPESASNYILTINLHDGALHPCSAKISKNMKGLVVDEPTAKYATPKNIFWGAFDREDVCN